MTDPTLHPHATVARGQHDVHDHGGTADDRVGHDARLSSRQMDGGHDHHAGNGHGGHDKHAGHDPEMFRRRFWLSLALTIPLVVTSEMVMDWFGYSLDFYGMTTARPGARARSCSGGAAGRSWPAASARSVTASPG